jgi:hypothetical protein
MVQETEKALVSLDEELIDIKTTLKQFEVLHSIRRCPADMLALIFESYLDHSSKRNRFKDALRLTEVCYRWCEIAVNLSSLWVSLPTSLVHTYTENNHMWAKISSRVKASPISITISDIYDWKYIVQVPDRLNFALFPNIEEIEFVFDHDSRLMRKLVQNMDYQLPPGRIRHLKIHNRNESWGLYFYKVDPTPIVHALSASGTLTTLTLHTFDFEYFSPNIVFAHIECIDLSYCYNLKPDRLIHAFPNAQSVTTSSFQHPSSTVHPAESFLWPNVHTVIIHSSYDDDKHTSFPLSSFKLPNIKQVHFEGERFVSHDLVDFLEMHHSLRTLDIHYVYSSFHGIKKGLPWLTSLSVSSRLNDHAIPWDEFTGLHNLTIYDTDVGAKLSCSGFDRFVCTRCLPGRGGSGVASTDWVAPVLAILVSKDFKLNGEGARDWQRSIWIPSARQSESIVTRWGEKYYGFSFQWS